MPLGKETLRAFENRSRESLVEEIMALRWLRTRLYLYAKDAEYHAAEIQKTIEESRAHQRENFAERGLGAP